MPIRPSRPAILRNFTFAALLILAVLIVLGRLASVWPALDILNDLFPVIAAFAALILLLAFVTREGRLIVAALVIATLVAAILGQGMQGGAASAPPDSHRFLRVVSFNLWGGNQRIDQVASFLLNSDADVLVLQEMRFDMLREALKARYPYSVGTWGLVIFSKFPVTADGRIDRTDSTRWHRTIVHWARINVSGTEIGIAGVHLERPYYANAQMFDIAALSQFLRNQPTPMIVAGDFNMTPWSLKLQHLIAVTGLRRFSTFHPTWPMRIHGIRSFPFAPIDNVLAARNFTAISFTVGPDLGSDHRPIVADIALLNASARIGHREETLP